jgi:hypothetical protein
MANNLVYCNNADSLPEAVGQQHDPNEWSPSIDSSKLRKKALIFIMETDTSISENTHSLH